MAKYTVLSADLKWAGERLFRGDRFETRNDRDVRDAELLVKIGRAEPAKSVAPRGHVASTRALEASDAAPAAAKTPELPPTSLGKYGTRRVRSRAAKRD